MSLTKTAYFQTFLHGVGAVKQIAEPWPIAHELCCTHRLVMGLPAPLALCYSKPPRVNPYLRSVRPLDASTVNGQTGLPAQIRALSVLLTALD